MAALFYYLGRSLQISGLVLGFLVILMFFNPANGESRLLILTCVSAGVFFGGHFLTRSFGSSD